jgi:hypothetical protein
MYLSFFHRVASHFPVGEERADRARSLLGSDDEQDGKGASSRGTVSFSNRFSLSHVSQAEATLQKATEHNPFIAEPHAVLAQILSSQKRYDEVSPSPRDKALSTLNN